MLKKKTMQHETQKLETQNVFLDTSIFEQNNFLDSKNIKLLIKHAEEETILLYSSQIAITELKERVRKKIKSAKSDIKNFRNQIPKPVEIFRNTDTYPLFEKIWHIDFLKEFDVICKKIDDLVQNTPILLIPTNGVKIETVFDKYFNNKAPFKEGVKKHEFPDAFILSSIDNWCEQNEDKMMIVSKDGDWLNYESEFIIKFKELDDLLNSIAVHKEIATKARLSFIDKAYQKNIDILEKEAKEFFENKADYDASEADLNKIEILKINWGEYMPIEIEEEYAELKIIINLQVKAYVSYQDYNTGY